MKVDYKAIFKLKIMLDNANIPYEFLDREYYGIALDKKEAFQEVLDFVNKGGKE